MPIPLVEQHVEGRDRRQEPDDPESREVDPAESRRERPTQRVRVKGGIAKMRDGLLAVNGRRRAGQINRHPTFHAFHAGASAVAPGPVAGGVIGWYLYARHPIFSILIARVPYGPSAATSTVNVEAPISIVSPFPGAITEFPVTAPFTDAPTNITAGPDGNLWFTRDGAKVGRITTGGVVTEFCGPPSG